MTARPRTDDEMSARIRELVEPDGWEVWAYRLPARGGRVTRFVIYPPNRTDQEAEKQ